MPTDCCVGPRVAQSGHKAYNYDAVTWMYDCLSQHAYSSYKYTGKEGDSESGLDNFEARYYSSSMGRFMQPDEFTGGPVDLFDPGPPTPDPLPYADIFNPQSLNKYAYVYNSPLRYVDPDGHDAWDVMKGAANAFGSDFFGGAGRQDSGNGDYRIGQAIGDFGATVVGAGEALLGGGGEVGGLALDATGVGAVAGVPVGVVSTAAVVQGSSAVLIGGAHLLKSSESTPATEPYKRPSGATTPEQRESVQGKPCVDCGKTESRMNANHKTPLVEEHYKTGTVNKTNMRSPNAVNSHCPTCSASQGGKLSHYSKKMKKKVKTR